MRLRFVTAALLALAVLVALVEARHMSVLVAVQLD